MSSRSAVGLFTLVASSVPAFAGREAGRDVFFSECIACHSVACNRAGPKLEELIGRPVGSVADYGNYSPAMKGSGVIWTEEALDAFFAEPATFIPNNGMAASFGGLEDAASRRDLIAFLAEPDDSVDLCY